MPVSDATLVRGVLAGDRAAFAELYERRARLIRAVCYSGTRELAAAADLTQDVFLRAYRRLDQLSDPEKFGPWLVGIARQVCREFQRRRRREERHLAARAQAEHSHSHEDVSQVQMDETLVQLRDAVASLSCKERLAIHAFYLQELDVDQARATLGLSRSGFYRVLSCARRRLRRMLSRAEVLQ